MNPFSSIVNNAFTSATNLVSGFLGKSKNTPATTITGPTQSNPIFSPTPTIDRFNQLAAQQPKQQPTQPVIQPTQPIAPAFTPEQIQQEQMNQKFTNNFPVQGNTTVSSQALAPDNTMSALKQTRQQLEQQYVDSFTQPSDTLAQLGKLRNEIADVTIRNKQELKDLERNPEGKLSGNLNNQIRELKDTQNERMANYAIREAALTGTLQLEKDQRKEVVDAIKFIAGQTDTEMVGSLQTDPITGDIFAFFKNPETGEMTQQTVGKTGIKPDLDIRNVGGRVVALDSSGNIVKDIGASSDGSGGGSFGVKFTPTDTQALFAAGLSGPQIQQLQSDINTFGFDAATSGLPQAQKNALTKTMGGSPRFLNPDYIINTVYGSNKSSLEDSAIKAGYGSKGFFGFGKEISDAELQQYVNDKIMTPLEAYRSQGMDDKTAWAALQKASK